MFLRLLIDGMVCIFVSQWDIRLLEKVTAKII